MNARLPAKRSVAVVKVGGASLDRPEFVDSLARHLELLREQHTRILLVHGGGKEIGQLHDRLGVSFEKRQGLRVTSDEGMELVAMVACGAVNKRVVARLQSRGLDALGLSGADLGLLRSDLLDPQRLGRVGDVPRVDRVALEGLLALGGLLVISPVCLGPDGGLLNVNADSVAQALAIAVDADRLELVTDVEHVRAPSGPRLSLSASDVEQLVAESVVRGGMLPKLEAGIAASSAGVSRVLVGNLSSLQRGAATQVVA